VAKETDTIAWITLPDGPQFARPADDRPRSRELLWAESDRSAHRLGARRTAYPLDLSIAELHRRGFCVPATFSELAGGTAPVDIGTLCANVERGTSVLILGEPGSGKSVASYALIDRLRQRTPAIAARMSELRRTFDTELGHDECADPRPVLVIDGLDETLGDFETAADLSDLLRHLADRFTLVVTCRRREFEDTVAHSVESGVFDSIYTIDRWSLDGQFTELITRLVRGGLLESDQLLEVIRGSPDLTRMVVRPLYARMLTFLGQDGLSAVTNVSTLYAEYIDKLAVASDVALTGAGCRSSAGSREIWVRAAWQIYANGMLLEDRFPLDPVTTLVGTQLPGEPRCLSRALSQICDQQRVTGQVWGSFVHYSFFEYLVSRHYLSQLNAVPSEAAEGLMECLSIDPSPEIRHFIVGELQATRVPGLNAALEDVYLRLRRAGAGTPRARTMGNLIAYLLSWAAGTGRASLRRLLDEETDMFLQQSLLWGLCHLGDRAALTQFARETKRSARWRAWNRGYVMYYYGDIDRRAEPPYVDDDPRRSWGRTRERSIALMSASGYCDAVAAQRRYLDLYLLYEYALWRGETLSGADARVARDALQGLWEAPGIDETLLHDLEAMHAVVCPS
jgi:hypothetical protein